MQSSDSASTVEAQQGCGGCVNAATCIGYAWSHARREKDSDVARPVRRVLAALRHLFWANDQPAHLYIVRSGAFKSVRHERDGSMRLTGFHFIGDALGLDMMLHGHVRDNVIALEPSEVCMIPLQGVRQTQSRSAMVGERVQRALGQTYIRLEDRLWLERFGAEQRLAAFMLSLASTLPSKPAGSRASFYLPMSHQDIGNYLGLAPETVSRLFARLQSRGYLSMHRRRLVHMLNVEALRRAVMSAPVVSVVARRSAAADDGDGAALSPG